MLPVSPVTEGWQFGSDGPLLVFDADRWTLGFGHAHGHFHSLADALSNAAAFLRGRNRFVEEFRDEMLATAWLEIQDGDAYEVDNVSMYLCPFDPDEWQLRPGEEWLQVRTTFDFDPIEGDLDKRILERRTTDGQGARSASLTWLEAGLGRASVGMRWTLGCHRRFVFQAPSGWRRLPSEDKKVPWVDFVGPDMRMILRVQNYFREEIPPSAPSERASGPLSIETSNDVADAAWHKHQWQLLFSDGADEMMAIVELFYQPQEDCTEIKERLDKSLTTSLLAPNEWDMKR